MKRFIYLITLLLLPLWLLAQTNISKVEYWYDGDYGTAVQQTVTPGLSVSYTDLLDVSSLEPGLHTFTVRFQDTRGIWGSVLTQFFTYYPGLDIGMHQVTDAQYWFDGNYATAVSETLTPGASADLNDLLDVSSLINGLHTATFRFKDDRGMWSAPMVRFFKKDADSGLKQLVAIEYWFNNDYASKHDSSFVATSSLDLTGMLDISTLREGFNFVNLRVQDEAGKWGPVASWFFTKENDGSLHQLHQLTALEYWYDGDYSTVQNDPVSATSLLALDTDLDVSALDDGLHMVSCRFRDETGEWSSAYSRLFSKYPDDTPAEMHEITALEYWFDGDITSSQTDPVTSTTLLDLDTQLDVSALSDGLHQASCRFRDEAGNWSPAFTYLFSKYPEEAVAEMHQLISVEYWIDGDISSSEKSAIPAGSDYVLNTQLDVSSINDGLHYITYRFQDEAGVWSSAYSELFSKYQDEIITANNKITAYRYWADNEIGSAVEVHLATPVKTFDIDGLIDISNFPGGEHVASFQFQDAQGQWSSAISQTYSKSVKPWVSISAIDSTVCAGSPVIFTADYADADVIEWQFGDGSTSNEFSPVHTYSSAGNYLVSAVVTHTDSMKSAYDTIVGGITVYPIYTSSCENLKVTTNTYSELVDLNQEAINEFGDHYSVADWNDLVAIADIDAWISCMGLNDGDFALITRNGNTIYSGNRHYFFAYFPLGVPSGFDYYASISNKLYLGSWYGLDMPILTKSDGTSIDLPVIDLELCSNDLPYQFGTQSLISEGLYSEVFTTIHGCDSIVQLNLTVHPAYSSLNMPDPDNLIAYYPFSGNASDESGNGHDGTVNGATLTEDRNGNANSAYLFDGNDGMDIPHSDELNMSGELSVSCWIKPTVLQDAMIFGKSNYSSATNYLLRVKSDGNIQWEYDGYLNTATKPLQANNWYHIVVTANNQGEHRKVYVNGQLIAETNISSGPFGSVTNKLTIGYASRNAEYFKGAIDDIRFYDKELTDAEVTALYQESDLIEEKVICASETPYTFGTQQLTQSGTYTENFNSIYGCDSIVTLKLEVIPISRDTLYGEVCENALPYYWRGREFISAGIYSDTLVSVSGCDSIKFLSLELYSVPRDTLYDTTCENALPYIWRGKEFLFSGIYSDTLTSSNGCDSIKTLSLEVHSALLDTLYDSTCENALPYIWRGKEFTVSGIYSDTLSSDNGCYSVSTLSLEVHPVYRDTLYDDACENSLPYIWRDKEFTGTGIYSDTLTSVSGCDSIKFLSLKVLPVFRDTLYDAACENALPYIWRDKEFLLSGIYSDTLTSNNGCDSIKFLSLEVIPASLDTLFAETCENDLPYIWRGKEYVATGIYSDSLISVNGCDSVKTLSLTVNPKYEVAVSDSVYRHKLPYQFGDQLLSASGEYADSLKTIHGCDSIINLTLKVIIDTIPPDVLCNSISVILNSSGNYSLTETDINSLAEGTTDNANEYEDLVVSVIPNSFSCSDAGTKVPVTVIVKDLEENTDTCYTTVSVLDESAPAITCKDISVTLDEDGRGNIDSENLYTSVSDACGISSVTISKNQFSCDDIGLNTVEIKAEDNNGNTGLCYADVNVQAFFTTPFVDSIKDIQILEDSVLDSFLITGIYDGSICSDDSLSFALSFSNNTLIESYAVDYVTGEDTAVFRLFPAQDLNGNSEVTLRMTNTVSGKEFSRAFGLTVLPVNDAPYSVFGLDDQKLTAGDSLILNFSSEKGILFDDVDEEDHLFLSLEQQSGEVLPDWLMFKNDSLFAFPSKVDTGCFALNIIATDTSGLEAISTFNLCVDHLVGINYFTKENLKVYPNPTTGKVYIDFITGGNNNFEISVWNVLGESVFQKSFTGGSILEIDLSDHVSGFYYLRVSQEHSEKIFKLILTHE